MTEQTTTTEPITASGFIFDDARVSATAVSRFNSISLNIYTADFTHTVVGLHVSPAAARAISSNLLDALATLEAEGGAA